MTGRATYVYCVVSAKKKPSAPKKRLLGAGAPRTVDVGGGYHLLVADVPLALYSADAIEAKLRDLEWVAARAAEHEAVVEDAAALGTVVPMKLFTLFASDERAEAHVRKMKKSLDKVVGRIEGCDEWGLRVLFDEGRANAVNAKRAARPTSGTSFLQRKRQLDDERRTVAHAAHEEVDDLYARLARAAKRALRRPAPNRELAGRVLLDAVFLVQRNETKKFKATVGAKAKELVKGGFAVSLTGPWPAYSFIGAR
jgi:hypothetical protein